MKKQLFLASVCVFLFVVAIILAIKIFRPPSPAFIAYQLLSRLTGKPACKDCNVILISLDTLSANHLPCYGYARNTAPNLCKFGEDNIIFKNAFSNASWTLPSHVSMFTGLYPSQHKIDGTSDNRLPSSIPFLPEILQQNGYKTYFYMPINDSHLPIASVFYRGINKIVEGDDPMAWDSGLETLAENNAIGQKTFLFLHTYWVHSPYILENKDRKLFSSKDRNFQLPETLEERNACTPPFITYLTKALESDLNNNAYSNDKKLLDKYKKINENLLQAIKNGQEIQFCNADNNKDYMLIPYHNAYYDLQIDVNDKESIDHQRNLYDSKITELDEYLKNTFEYILNSNLKNNTIIVVVGDHGEEFMEHGAIHHGNNLFDTSTKVPLMMYIPGQNKRVADQLAQGVDILPTILGLLKLNYSNKISGSDLFNNNDNNSIKYAVAQQIDGVATIRDSEWKLFYQVKNNKAVGWTLFNYKKDSLEENDVFFKNPEVVNRLLNNIP